MVTTEYVDRELLKESLFIKTNNHDEILDGMLKAAREAIDAHTGQNFLLGDAGTIRYFDSTLKPILDIDELQALTLLRVDTDLDGGFATTLVEGVDFELYPLNKLPKFSIKLKTLGQINNFLNGEKTVEITGTWGHAEVPALITQAVCCTVGRWYKRRDKDYTEITKGGTANVLDPDVIVMLQEFKGDAGGKLEVIWP